MIDYNKEFQRELNCRLSKFINKIKPLLKFGNISMTGPITIMMKQHLMLNKENYIENRKAGEEIEHAFSPISHYLDIFRAGFNEQENDLRHLNSIHHPWEDTLKNYTGQFLIYIFNNDILKTIYPTISNIPYNTLLMSEQNIADEFEFNENFTELPIDFTTLKKYKNNFLEKNFPFIYFYANTFSWLISILRPKSIVFFEGNYIQNQILGLLSRKYRIPSILIKIKEESRLTTNVLADHIILPEQLLQTLKNN